MTELLFSLALTLTMLPLGFFFSCSSCCGCTIWSDSFTVDLTSTDYDTRAGSFTVTGGNLDCTTANSLIVADSTLSTTTGVVRVQISYSALANGDKLRVIGNYKDDNNYLIGEIERTSSTLGIMRLYSRVAGVETLLDSKSGLSLNLSVDYCLSWSSTIAMFTDGSVPTSNYVREEYTPDAAGYQAGLGSGSTVTGTVRFGLFSIARHPDESATCTDCRPCTPCSDLEPDDVTVDITGVTNGSCATCANYNTTWVLIKLPGSCGDYYYDNHGVCFAGFGDDITYRLQRPAVGNAFHRLFSKDFDSGNVSFGATTIVCLSRTETISSFVNGTLPSCTVTGMSADITFNP